MSTGGTDSTLNGHEKSSLSKEQEEKINEVRRSLGPLKGNLAIYCTDAALARYLRARNWNVKKALKMLKSTLKWRLEYKPEEIRWDDIAKEADTGKIYRLNHTDKYGRTVLVMRPSSENSKSTKGKIKYLVYCMENAVLNMAAHQEQMVWLIDFHGFNLSNVSVNVTRETANVLQNCYPERLGIAILYNPPKFFESFWTVVKPFLEPKTCKKVNFVYSDDLNSKKIMEDLFDMDQLESSFGGKNPVPFNINEYAERMREDDKRMPEFWSRKISPVTAEPTTKPLPPLDSVKPESDSGKPEPEEQTSSHEIESDELSHKNNLPEAHPESSNGTSTGHSNEGIANK